MHVRTKIYEIFNNDQKLLKMMGLVDFYGSTLGRYQSRTNHSLASQAKDSIMNSDAH